MLFHQIVIASFIFSELDNSVLRSKRLLSGFSFFSLSTSFVYDVRTYAVTTPLFEEESLSSPIVTLHPTMPYLVTGLTENSVTIYDIRKLREPLHQKEFGSNYDPFQADYSPDGTKLMIALSRKFKLNRSVVSYVFDVSGATYEDFVIGLVFEY